MLRAGSDAHPATYAKRRADMGDTVINADCVAFADRFAVAVAETAERAFSRTTIEQICCRAGFNAFIDFFSFRRLAVAAAMDYRDLFDNVCKFNAEHLRELFCNGVRSGNTKVDLRIAFYKCRRITVTACVSAGTAVDARQASADGFLFFIDFYIHKMRGKRKHDSAYEPDSRNDGNGNKNIIKHGSLLSGKEIFNYSRKSEKGKGND